MNDQIVFIFKLLIVSTLLSAIIKYGGPLLSIRANNTNALIAILLPTLVFFLILSWRWQQTKQSNIRSED